MASYKDKILDLAESQVGYAETGDNVTKYAKEFDTTWWQWFNTKKQGSSWCSIFICYLFCTVLGPDKAYKFLGLPKNRNDNCAAGVPYLAKYLTALGWKLKDKSKGQAGDIIVFNNDTHVGIIKEVADGKYKTIEGNKSNKVGRGNYVVNSTKISGIYRPDYASLDVQPTPEPTPAPTPEPTPTPTPTPTPKPSVTKYKVSTKTGVALRLREKPNTSSKVIASMPNGSIVESDSQSNGWAHVISYTPPKKSKVSKTGYASMSYLKKV